jgi:hypothetical protein
LCFAVVACALCLELPSKQDSVVSLTVLPNPQVLRIVGRSQLEFVADLFWVRMANMAGRAKTTREYASLLPIGNLIADVSPKFKYPYFLGGALAPVRKFPTREYDNAKEAVALMARGTAEVPDYPRLYVQKAFSEMEMLHDKQAAAQTLMQAARTPGAPSYIAGLATRLLAEEGRFDDATRFAELLTRSDDPEVRADFEHRLLQIKLEQVLVAVDEASERKASCPSSPGRRGGGGVGEVRNCKALE